MLKDMPINEQPREKLLEGGVERLSTAELLAIVLRTGSKNRSAIQLAFDIMAQCRDDVSEIAGLSAEELCRFEGIGESKACQILSAIELGRRVHSGHVRRGYRIGSPEDVVAFFQSELSGLKVEKFIAVLLDTKNQIINWEVVSVGSLNASIVHPREVFVRAVRKSAASIIAVHNHPSGDVTPSAEDRNLTIRLTEAGKLMGITLLDHLIIGKNTYYSFKEHELI